MTRLISAETLKTWLHDGQEIAVLDVREHGQYGESHLFYGTSVPFSRLEREIGRLVPRRSARLVVYDSGMADTEGVAERAAAQLERLGYGDVHQLDGGTRAWKVAGYALFAGVNLPSKTFGELAEHAYGTPRVSADRLASMIASGEPVVVLDGRPVSEFRKMNIPTATCCPNGELAYRVHSLVPDESTPIVVNCAGRTRSIIGAQTLINLGLRNPIYALENGTQGWFLRDYPLEHGGSRQYGLGGAALKESAERLAQRFAVPVVDAHQVRAWVEDSRRSLFLCDVRSPEEFAAGTLPGARHTPGGQLMQACDQYVGVRGARLVLFDDDGVRAPTVASWLVQMGHDACVLAGGLSSGLALPIAAAPEPAPLEGIEAAELHALMQREVVEVWDLRGSMAFRAAHLPGARWSIRPRLAAQLSQASRPVVLVADDAVLAAWAVASEWPEGLARPRLLNGCLTAWREAGLPVEATPDLPEDVQCIDYLFFVHDRHDGNKEAARRYLAWETGLVAQLDSQELASFRLPPAR